ncbi:MAG: hypothetical protein ACYS0J_21285 [Planctomycetota bacterium]|jgi:hypothetical protein
MSDDGPHPGEAELLRTLLASRDIPCPVCTYNLHGNESSDCPECGANLDLRVGSTDLKLGLALPLGFIGISGLFRIVIMIVYLADSASAGLRPSYLVFTAIPILISVGYGILLWRLVRRRRKFWTRPRRVQRRRAVLYAVLGPAALLVPMLLMLLF